MKSHLLTILCFFTLAFGLNAQVTSVGLIGSATPGGWDNETPMTKLTDSTWTLDITLTTAACKFRANNNWDLSWGDKAFPTGIGSSTPGSPDIPVFAGDYTVTFNSNSGAYYFDVDSDIGIIGDATPGGWDKGTLMDYDAETQKWSVTVTLGDGEMKFRWDAAWTINFGGSLGALTQDGGNIKVSAGTYTIVLDPEAKNATMTAN